jgi:hypothetical protein
MTEKGLIMSNNDFETDDQYDLDNNYELAKSVVTDFLNDKPASAQDAINDLMTDKVRDTIAGQRVEVASSLMDPQVEAEPEVEPEIEYDSDESDTDTEEEENEDVQGD